MIDFTTLQGLTIPEGVVTQITDESGRVIWAVSGGKVILEVEKFTSDTYAGGTTYTAEEFILLDIYPKTNGTVSVTYGGLTKTITDTSGVEEPNAQQVVFGTFYGVSDEVETPANGELTIEGDFRGFGRGAYQKSKIVIVPTYCNCIKVIRSLGKVEFIPSLAFGKSGLINADIVNNNKLIIPNSVKSIGEYAFAGSLTSTDLVIIPNSVKSIGSGAFEGCYIKSVKIGSGLTSVGENPFGCPLQLGADEFVKIKCFIEVSSKNTAYKIDGNCLIEIDTNRLISGFDDSIIPQYITEIGTDAFRNCKHLTHIEIPDSVVSIGAYSFAGAVALESVTFANPTGWYATAKDAEGNTTEIALDLSDPANNAYMLRSATEDGQYGAYEWFVKTTS